MGQSDLAPYEFARQRFSHACLELENDHCALQECLLNAIIALSPLRAEDMPPDCNEVYEKLQEFIGQSYWYGDALSGALAKSVLSLPLQRAADAAKWIAMASATLDKYCWDKSRG